MCDVEPGETFLARERIYRVTEDTSEFPDGSELWFCAYTQTSLCTHLRCVYVRGKMERLFLCFSPSLLCFYSFSLRPCLHQEGKKKLIPDPFTTRTQQRHSTKGRNTLRKLRLTCTITFRKST